MKSQDCGEGRNHLSCAVVCFCSSFISLGKLGSEAVSAALRDSLHFVNPVFHPVLSEMGGNIWILHKVARHDGIPWGRIPRSSFRFPL